jgi:hypothetical protein
MDRLPLTLYDVLACVVSGLVLLVEGDTAFGADRLLQGDLSLASSVVVVIGAYILGHVVAHLSGFLFERAFVRAYLGAPDEVLLRERRRGIRAFIFPGYFDPLSELERGNILAKGKGVGLDPAGREIFSYALPRVRRAASGSGSGKLETFLNLYGFCRNTSFAVLCAGGLLLVGGWLAPWQLLGGPAAEACWGVASILVGVILFYRYLKFFRLYTAEVYHTYAALDV